MPVWPRRGIERRQDHIEDGLAYMSDHRVEIEVSRQRLRLYRGRTLVAEYPVSTALNGVGERRDSGCTPRGWHVIRAKIGGGQPANTVFVARRPTGETYSPALAAAEPKRDWILTRILWLSGLEKGKNRLGNVDTFRRFIYMHGCPDELPMGRPASHGCVRMRNADVIALFDTVALGTRVLIKE